MSKTCYLAAIILVPILNFKYNKNYKNNNKKICGQNNKMQNQMLIILKNVIFKQFDTLFGQNKPNSKQREFQLAEKEGNYQFSLEVY